MTNGLSVNPELDMESMSHGNFFIQHIFPDMTGFAKRMDEYYLNKEAGYYVTAVDRKIDFHDSNNDDPDATRKEFRVKG